MVSVDQAMSQASVVSSRGIGILTVSGMLRQVRPGYNPALGYSGRPSAVGRRLDRSAKHPIARSIREFDQDFYL